MNVLRVDSEDLRLVISDSDSPLLRLDATGWLDYQDMVNLRDFLVEAINTRRPAQETPAVRTFTAAGPERGMSTMCQCGQTFAKHIAQDHAGNACVCP